MDTNPNCDTRVAAGDTPLIDDFEDGDDLLNGEEGRDGDWWTATDETAEAQHRFAIEVAGFASGHAGRRESCA